MYSHGYYLIQNLYEMPSYYIVLKVEMADNLWNCMAKIIVYNDIIWKFNTNKQYMTVTK